MTSLIEGFDKGLYKAISKYESCVIFSIYSKEMKPLKALIFLMECFLNKEKNQKWKFIFGLFFEKGKF